MSADLTKAVTYRSFLVNDPDVRANVIAGDGLGSGIGGCVLDKITFGSPELVQFREKRALQDGMDAGDPYFGGRLSKLQGTIYARSRPALYDFYQQLRAAFTSTLSFRQQLEAKGFQPLLFDRATLREEEFDGDTIHLRLMVIPQEFACDIDRDVTGGVDGQPLGLPFVITLYSRQPIIQGRDLIVVDLPLAASEGQPCTGEADTDIITSTLHGLEDGDTLYFVRLVGGAGLSVGVRYFVINATTDTFQVTTAISGLPINFTTDITSAIHVAVDAELVRLTPVDIGAVGGPVSAQTVIDLAAYASGDVTAYAGVSRYATAAMVSAAKFAPDVAKVFIVNGLSAYDAVVAAGAAVQAGAPVLFVTTTIPAVTVAELVRLNPMDIVCVGGGVSAAVVASLGAYAVGSVVRYAGSNRYSTSALVSAATFAPGVDVVYIYPGWSSTTDISMLCDGAVAAAASGTVVGPVLAVAQGGIPVVIKTELTRLTPSDIIIVGGRVSAAIETALAAYTSGSVTRISGTGALETAAALSAATFAPGADEVWVAERRAIVDQAVAAAAAGLAAGPLLLVASGSSAFISPLTLTGTLTNRGDYYVPVNMLLRVTGNGTITVSIGNSFFTIIVPDSANERIIRVKGAPDNILTVEENGVESLRMDMISFDGANTWPEIPTGDSPYSLTLAGVSIVGVEP